MRLERKVKRFPADENGYPYSSMAVLNTAESEAKGFDAS